MNDTRRIPWGWVLLAIPVGFAIGSWVTISQVFRKR